LDTALSSLLLIVPEGSSACGCLGIKYPDDASADSFENAFFSLLAVPQVLLRWHIDPTVPENIATV
jgi:hypothetical protein